MTYAVFYRGKLVHRFKKGITPTKDQIHEAIINKGYYQCEVRSFEPVFKKTADHSDPIEVILWRDK